MKFQSQMSGKICKKKKTTVFNGNANRKLKNKSDQLIFIPVQ